MDGKASSDNCSLNSYCATSWGPCGVRQATPLSRDTKRNTSTCRSAGIFVPTAVPGTSLYLWIHMTEWRGYDASSKCTHHFHSLYIQNIPIDLSNIVTQLIIAVGFRVVTPCSMATFLRNIHLYIRRWYVCKLALYVDFYHCSCSRHVILR
jgi:hypothetical protein